MNGTCLHSDVVLPAATWYEKHDISTTDLHPFVHSFNPAIAPPWEARTDWDTFRTIAAEFSRAGRAAPRHRPTWSRRRSARQPDELAQPLGEVRDWRAGECEPVPGKTMPKLIAVERDYGAVAEKMGALGPLVEELGTPWKGLSWVPDEEVEALRRQNGEVESGIAAGRPSLERADQACEAILALSGTSNGRLAIEGLRDLEGRAGVELVDLAAEHADERISFRDVGIQPRKTLTSAEWSGIESRDRRYSPFTMNVDREVPWRTLTGRQQLYQDHEWMLAGGECLPTYKAPLPAPATTPAKRRSRCAT